jgi:hypothetical protein
MTNKRPCEQCKERDAAERVQVGVGADSEDNEVPAYRWLCTACAHARSIRRSFYKRVRAKLETDQ